MRAEIDGERPLVEAASNAVDQNTADLTDAITTGYGAQTGAEFSTLWAGHVSALKRYSGALAVGDTAAAGAARADLESYEAAYGALLQLITRGGLNAVAMAGGARRHIAVMLAQADAYAKDDFATAYRLEAAAYSGMSALGKSIAAAALARPGGSLPATFDNASERLRLQLVRLLGAHVELSFDATRVIVGTGAPRGTASLRQRGDLKSMSAPHSRPWMTTRGKSSPE
jgi:hypothetical protein